MILPVVAYGDPVLKESGATIAKDYPNLAELIANMFETMYHARGVGLAAPQIGLAIRLFVIDASGFDEEKFAGMKKVFINPEIIEETGEDWAYEEGCLSIPGIRADVWRPEKLRIRYTDEHWVTHEEEFDDMLARVIQHEFDHIEGVLFIDHLSALKKKLLQSKLRNITKGQVDVSYRMRFPKK
jgi:peptide deformylase